MRKLFRYPLVGPLFGFELVRLARSGRFFLLRCLYALALLLVLAVTYRQWAGSWANWGGYQHPGHMAEQFTLTILMVQNVAVLLLAPLYLAPSITLERERGTLDLLFTTHLHAHEIILGKFLARSVILGSILLGGLPVLALLHMLGGVNLWLVLGGFFITGLTVLYASSLSIFCSTLDQSTRQAIVSSYVFLLMIFNCCCFVNPFIFLMLLDARLNDQPNVFPEIFAGPGSANPLVTTAGVVASCALLQGFCILLHLLAAAYCLRIPHPDRVAPISPTLPKKKSAPAKTPLAPPEPGPLARPFVEIESDPLWRKESLDKNNVMGGIFFVFALAIILFILLLMIPLTLTWGERSFYHQDLGDRTALFLFLAALTGICCFEALRTTACLSREREQRTLESLLTIPLDRSELLRIKLLAGCWHYRKGAMVLALYLLPGLMLQTLHPLGAVLCLVAGVIHVLFFITLGLWLSLVCRSTLQARLVLGGIIFAVIVGPWLISPPGLLDYWQLLVNPILCWNTLAFNWGDLDSDTWPKIRLCLVNLLIYATAGWMLWCSSCRSFAVDPLHQDQGQGGDS